MIRNATHRDIGRMVELGALMHAESKFRAYDFDPEKLASLIGTLIELDGGIAFVYERADKIIGGFLGLVTEHYFGHDKQATDLALFIEPSARGGVQAMLLLAEYVKKAKALGAAEVVIANATGVEKDRVAKLFEHIGFKQDGYVFSMNVKDQPCA